MCVTAKKAGSRTVHEIVCFGDDYMITHTPDVSGEPDISSTT